MCTCAFITWDGELNLYFLELWFEAVQNPSKGFKWLPDTLWMPDFKLGTFLYKYIYFFFSSHGAIFSRESKIIVKWKLCPSYLQRAWLNVLVFSAAKRNPIKQQESHHVSNKSTSTQGLIQSNLPWFFWHWVAQIWRRHLLFKSRDIAATL